jgi:hypothetical protein
MYLFPRCLRMLIDAILVSTNTRTHTPSLSLSLPCLALPSSIYKALRCPNLDQSKYTFLRIHFSHFKGSTSTKIAFVNTFHFNLVVMFVYFVNQSSVLSSILNGVTNFIIHLVVERMTRYR